MSKKEKEEEINPNIELFNELYEGPEMLTEYGIYICDGVYLNSKGEWYCEPE